ncbi:MAG: hypothetical protein KDI31_15810 [Pseudomonadales bacterium]|nr:hypothetical protein [Pseudomonadales bacterium]
MGNYQVLFSGEVSQGVREETVQANLARELGIDDRKARQLFSGRTVVIRSQLTQEEAQRLQARFADFGALCRIKDLTPRTEPKLDYRIDRDDRGEGRDDKTLRDITAAHMECPRCGHLQLETSHCARCGIDIGAALKAKRKEDLIIEKKIREMRDGRQPPRPKNVEEIRFETATESETGKSERKNGVMSWFRKTS